MKSALFLLPLIACVALAPCVPAHAQSPLSESTDVSEATAGQKDIIADPMPQRYELAVRASEINPQAQEHPELGYVFAGDKGKPADVQHAIVDTRVAPRGELVIWLMGHNQELFERIASYGLHGIQVHYANGWFGKIDPQHRDDGTSLGKIRLEAATGDDYSPLVDIPKPDGMTRRTQEKCREAGVDDYSPLVDIPKPDGMTQRALRFVRWLAQENPQGNWQQFLTDDASDLRWEKVIMAGISHGSTTAARFAKHQKVARVVMFSGPRDQLESWQGFPSATPANRYFGFTHVLDTGWTGDHYCRSWLMLGLAEFGPLVDVDQASPPYKNSRRLITNSDVNKNPGRAHSASVPGRAAVKNADGHYIHEAVWRYLFTHPVDEVGEPVPAESDCRLDLRK